PFELAPIYERHAELTRLEKAKSIGLAVNGGRGVRELWRFACEGYLGDLTREHAERAAMLEAELEVTVDGQTIPYRMIRPTLANEPDRDRRERRDRVRVEIVEERFNANHLEASQAEQRAARELGAPTSLDPFRKPRAAP